MTALEEKGLHVDQIQAEAGPGQFEVAVAAAGPVSGTLPPIVTVVEVTPGVAEPPAVALGTATSASRIARLRFMRLDAPA